MSGADAKTSYSISTALQVSEAPGLKSSFTYVKFKPKYIWTLCFELVFYLTPGTETVLDKGNGLWRGKVSIINVKILLQMIFHSWLFIIKVDQRRLYKLLACPNLVFHTRALRSREVLQFALNHTAITQCMFCHPKLHLAPELEGSVFLHV